MLSNNGSILCWVFNREVYVSLGDKDPKFSFSPRTRWFCKFPINFPIHIIFNMLAAAAAKSLQSCPTLCDPIDGSPPGSLVPGILQARTLEWVAISFSNAWKWKVKVKLLSRVRLLAIPQTAAYQASPSMGFSRQEYWKNMSAVCI